MLKIANVDTPVCLFSASKMITAMLIHLLDESGEINLLDPVSHYIPEYAIKWKIPCNHFPFTLTSWWYSTCRN